MFVVEVDEIDVKIRHPLQAVTFEAIGNGEFLGINAVCFRFSAVNGFQVERVTEQKWRVEHGTQVSEPAAITGLLGAAAPYHFSKSVMQTQPISVATGS